MTDTTFAYYGHVGLCTHHSMATNKRRKLDIAPSPQRESSLLLPFFYLELLTRVVAAAMSAFALRKTLLAAQTYSSPTSATSQQPDTNDTTETTRRQTQDTASPRKLRKSRLARPKYDHEGSPGPVSAAPLQSQLTPERGLSSEPPPLPTQPVPVLAHEETPIDPPPILFSNFKPSKSNYQKRKDGRIHLKLAAGEVCSAHTPSIGIN